MTDNLTYADAGVDILKEEQAIKGILKHMTHSRTSGIGMPLGGHYAGLIDFGENALVLCTDGVGSKVEIAHAIKKYDTVGIDCIAMNVNDAICVGAEPLAFVDYLAIDDPKPEITTELGKGLAEGARQSNMNIIGGETASLPEVINGFDLAGTCLAYVKKERIITGEHIQPGDAILGISSSGIHSNGYTLARKVVEKTGLSYTDRFPGNAYPNKTLGEVLLTPTRIYVKETLELFKHTDVHGLAHITGGGLRNLNRLNDNVQFTIEEPITPPAIFKWLQQEGNITDHEMYKTFNMGMGLAIILPAEQEELARSILKEHSDYDAKLVGHVEKGKGTYLKTFDLRY